MKVVYIKDSAGIKKGVVKNLPLKLAQQMIKLGICEVYENEVIEEKVVKTPKNKKAK